MKRRLILIIAALVLLAAVVVAGVFHLRGTESSIATVTLDGAVVASYDLSQVQEEETFTVGAPGAQNTIRVSPEGIAVIYADCPDQVCVQMGTRRHGPEPIVCLPHKLSITFSDNSDDLDAVAGQ